MSEIDSFIQSCNDAALRAAQPFASLPTILQNVAGRVSKLERENDTIADKVARLEAENGKLNNENGELRSRVDQLEQSQASNCVGFNDRLREMREHLTKTANNSASRIQTLVKEEAEVVNNSLNGEREARRAAIEQLSGKHVELVNTICALQHGMDMLKNSNNGGETDSIIRPVPITPRIQQSNHRALSGLRGSATPLAPTSHYVEANLRKDLPRVNAPPFLGQFPPSILFNHTLQTSTPSRQAVQASRRVAQTPINNTAQPLNNALAPPATVQSNVVKSRQTPLGPPEIVDVVRGVNTRNAVASQLVDETVKGQQTTVPIHSQAVREFRGSVAVSRPTPTLSHDLLDTSTPAVEQQTYAIAPPTADQDKQTANFGGSVPDTVSRDDPRPTRNTDKPPFSWLNIHGFLDKPAPAATKAVPKMQQDLFRSMWQFYGEPGLLKDYARQCLDKGLTGNEYGSMAGNGPTGWAKKDARGTRETADEEVAVSAGDISTTSRRVNFPLGPSHQANPPKVTKAAVINADPTSTAQPQKNIEGTEAMTAASPQRETARKQIRVTEPIEGVASSIEPTNNKKTKSTMAADTATGEKRKRKPTAKAQRHGKKLETSAASNMDTDAEMSSNDAPPKQRQKTVKQVRKISHPKALRKRAISTRPTIVVSEPLDTDEEIGEPPTQKGVKANLLGKVPGETEEQAVSPTVASLGFVFRKTKDGAKNGGLGPQEKAGKRVSSQAPV